MRIIKTSCALLAALSFLGPMMLFGQEVLLTDDAQINSAATTANYGSSGALAVSSTNSVLLQFDLADVLPAGVTSAQVTRARLILFPDKVSTIGNFNVYGITGTWTEGGVTYATRPSVSSSVAGTGAVKLTYRSAFVAVTGLVQSWIANPSTNHGFEVKASGTTSFTMDSKENTATSTPAILQIDLVGPAGPPGPTGATGSTGPQGPAGTLKLPYSQQVDGGGATLLTIINGGTSAGAGIQAVGANTSLQYGTAGSGMVAYGGEAGVVDAHGGYGIRAYGGEASTSDFTASGAGGFFEGADGLSGSTPGEGIQVYGGYSDTAGAGALAIYAAAPNNSYDAAEFNGDVHVDGNLSKAGGSFRIDHPLDPENKYLSHSFVESPDMMNIYNGNVVTDSGGYAVVTLPEWFEALNQDFRYQLTPVGQFAQAMVASELANGRFTIRTDKGNVKVSWQLTGIRHDAWANAHRIPVEEEKPEKERGHYTHPELYGHAGEPSISELKHPRPKPVPHP